jgi:hypothetical protein
MPRSQSELPKVAIKIDPKISVGLGTVVGILGAIVQYLGALALILVPGDLTPEAITTMATATLTLYKTLDGRFKQADSAIKAVAHTGISTPATATTETTSPEPNVLYLDSESVARALVRTVNTNALMGELANRPVRRPDEPAIDETGGK